MDVGIPGYTVIERRRSDSAGDKSGGGLLFYLRNDNGLVFTEHSPAILNPAHAFVKNERMWVTCESLRQKTAVCGLYLGFQASDDRHATWNQIMYEVLKSEVIELRRAGYRVVLKGDFNGHVGDQLGRGVVGNHPAINRNGERLLSFLDDVNACHLNGACRVQDDWSSRISRGTWTRQRGGISTILDYGVVSREHLESVKSFVIDDCGDYPSGSDHNWSFLEMEDRFVTRRKLTSNKSVKKPRWNFGSNHDWSGFCDSVERMTGDLGNETKLFEDLTVAQLAERGAEILLESARNVIGFKTQSSKKVKTTLPRDIVSALEFKAVLEGNWKSKASALSSIPHADRDEVDTAAVAEAERLYNEQKLVVKLALGGRRFRERKRILEKCSGNSVDALKCFWSFVSQNEKKSSDIDCVTNPDTKNLVDDKEGIKTEVENHLLRVFKGSFQRIVSDENVDHELLDHPYASEAAEHDQVTQGLPVGDGSGDVKTDPQGWLDKVFSPSELKKAIKKLQNCKAMGFDMVPNEFIKNSGPRFLQLLTILFNRVKSSGVFPRGWNAGRVVLVHKKGVRDVLGNYRPLTVIVSLSGLYSRVLNERLVQVVEIHNLLGEVQQGFRRGRMGADNAFILDSIIWKAKSRRRKVFMAFFDIQKAYDTVDRNVLWRKMSRMGFGGQFLDTLKSIYSGDTVQTEMNGLKTRPVFLRRGLRQGCSLSPMLFNLYVADLGNALDTSEEGFQVGGVCVSALFFADDLVVFARSREGLLRLMTMVKQHADWLKMVLNTDKDKSEVLAQMGVAGDTWDILDREGEVVLSLKQVLEYRYLGTKVFSSMAKTAVEKVKNCVAKAHRYKGSCIHISKEGPDLVDMMMATWCNVAIPSILFGCEMIPFSETSIQEIERVQSQVAKYALGLPLGAANICAQTELGMKPFRHALYEAQLKYYVRVLELSDTRWVKQALLDHLSSAWESPYIKYIHKIRMELDLVSLPSRSQDLEKVLRNHFVQKLNASILSLKLPWIRPVSKLRRLKYTREGQCSEAIAAFRFDAACIGHKYPRLGRVDVQTVCPLCSFSKNTLSHLAFFCPSLEAVRKQETVLGSYRNMCVAKGLDEAQIFEMFVNGEDWNENVIPLSDFLARGGDLKLLLDSFLQRW